MRNKITQMLFMSLDALRRHVVDGQCEGDGTDSRARWGMKIGGNGNWNYGWGLRNTDYGLRNTELVGRGSQVGAALRLSSLHSGPK